MRNYIRAGLLALSLTSTPSAFSQGCGLMPLKPLVPYGCKDLKARCDCVKDKDGNLKCEYVWVCVPN